jgi:Raptor N-terminal CASPase like domain
MVTLAAIASSRPGSLELPEIPESKLDARSLYAALAHVVGTGFDHTQSMCLIDPARADVSSLLSNLSVQMNRDEMFIIFYSGHGTLEGTRLFLNFADASQNGKGKVSVTELGEWLRSCQAEVLLILDCCHSGIALNLANRGDPFEDVRISVLASAECHAKSTFTGLGSDFTRALTQTLSVMFEQKHPLSLVGITDALKRAHGQQCTLNVRQGIEDLVIPSAADDGGLPHSFTSDFLRSICDAPLPIREMLWYSVIDVDLDRRLDVLRHYFLDVPHSEPSWLARRALGTALNSCRASALPYYELIYQLVSSNNWMKCASGVIGVKGSLDDSTLRDLVKKSLDCDRMDLTWLAHLYLADARAIGVDEALDTKLTKTGWGIADIATRWLGTDADQERTIGKIIERCSENEVKQALGTHCRCLNLMNQSVAELPYDREITESALVRFLYASKKRGRTLAPRLKWMLSSLYGTWRDQLQSDVAEWLMNRPVQDGISQLSLCARVPSVEVRMSVFQFLTNRLDLRDTYREGLLWGIKDSHPWVRRVAISTLRTESDAHNALRDTFDMSLYPGVLDLHLEAFRLGLSNPESLNAQSLTAVENGSISWAFQNEAKHSGVNQRSCG